MKDTPPVSQPPQKEHQGSTKGNTVTHYENFPVASVLCPAHLRPAVVAIYNFARTADDIADGLAHYADERDRPDRDVTSRLSPYLHFGQISPLEIVDAVRTAGGRACG